MHLLLDWLCYLRLLLMLMLYPCSLYLYLNLLCFDSSVCLQVTDPCLSLLMQCTLYLILRLLRHSCLQLADLCLLLLLKIIHTYI